MVAFATSAPELVATLVASVGGSPQLALGNVLGSNIANLGLILGLAAVVQPLPGGAHLLRREVPLVIGVAIVPFALLADGAVGRLEGAALVLSLAAYVGLLVWRHKPEPALEEVVDELEARPMPGWLAAGGVVVGVGLLVLGAHLLVDGAVDLARGLGVSERVIGLSLVAVGTSLPELASCLVAARRREGDLVLGNVVGSNAARRLRGVPAGARARMSAALFFSALACLAYAAHGLLGLGLVRVLPRWEPLVGLAALCVLVGFLLYRGSIHLQRRFDETFKSVFDLYRDRFKVEPVLEEIIAVTGSEAIRTAPKRDQYLAVWRYLQNYRVDTPAGRLAPPKVPAPGKPP